MPLMNSISLDFRLPRMIITILAGAALSISGAIVQSVTKNPIAEPGILGINAGGGFAITLFIAIGKINADNFVYVLPLISILGGITAALIILFSVLIKMKVFYTCEYGINRCRFTNSIIWWLNYNYVKI